MSEFDFELWFKERENITIFTDDDGHDIELWEIKELFINLKNACSEHYEAENNKLKELLRECLLHVEPQNVERWDNTMIGDADLHKQISESIK